jgi:hypothetical protein
MECSKCGFENPECMKFCRECAAKLEVICPSCKASNPPKFKFCGTCADPLTPSSTPLPKEPTFDEKFAKIKKYLPSGLTEKILSQHDRIEGERKQVTVLFTDMERYASLTEKIDPEEAYPSWIGYTSSSSTKSLSTAVR